MLKTSRNVVDNNYRKAGIVSSSLEKTIKREARDFCSYLVGPGYFYKLLGGIKCSKGGRKGRQVRQSLCPSKAEELFHTSSCLSWVLTGIISGTQALLKLYAEQLPLKSISWIPFQRRLWNLFWPSLNKGHLLSSRTVLLALLEVGIWFSDLVNSSAAPGFHSSISSIVSEKQL